ncbi:hypothetical protein LEMLEM_LOCUS25568 [Lemmus lemmus]
MKKLSGMQFVPNLLRVVFCHSLPPKMKLKQHQENQQDHDVFLHQSHLGPRGRHLKSLLCLQLCNLGTILQDHHGP